MMHQANYDELTGLSNRYNLELAIEKILNDADKKHIFIAIDLDKFKAVNDIFGNAEGDRLLVHIAKSLEKVLKPEDFSCRSNADRFIFFTKTSGKELGILVDKLMDCIADYNLPFEIMCNMGIYVTCDTVLPAGMMIDRARLAQSTIK